MHLSEHKNIRCGVPQGSILGPILFLVYINDLSNVSHVLKCILFADDTSIFFSHNDVNSLQDIFNNELQLITKWLNTNKLLINVSKTNFMVFTKKKCNIDAISINMCNSEIKTCLFFEICAEIFVDNNLNWSNHINFICNKLSKNIGVLYRLKSLPKSVLKLLIYNTLIIPHINYCITALGNAHDHYIQRIIFITKTSDKNCCPCPFLAHIQPMFSSISLKLLRLNDMYNFQVGIFMYLSHHCLLPKSLLELFFLNSNFHIYSTRSANNYHLPQISYSFLSKNNYLHWSSTMEFLTLCNKKLKVFKYFKIQI